jgi:hypothetical protein
MAACKLAFSAITSRPAAAEASIVSDQLVSSELSPLSLYSLSIELESFMHQAVITVILPELLGQNAVLVVGLIYSLGIRISNCLAWSSVLAFSHKEEVPSRYAPSLGNLPSSGSDPLHLHRHCRPVENSVVQ